MLIIERLYWLALLWHVTPLKLQQSYVVTCRITVTEPEHESFLFFVDLAM